MASLVVEGGPWVVRQSTRLFNCDPKSIDYSADLALSLGLVKMSDGTALFRQLGVQQGQRKEGQGGPLLVSVVVQVDASNSRSLSLQPYSPSFYAALHYSPPSLLPVADGGGGSGVVPTTGFLLEAADVSGDQRLSRLSDRVVSWIESKFDCYVDLPCQSALSARHAVSLLCALALLHSGLEDPPESLTLECSIRPSVAGVASVSVALPLAALCEGVDSAVSVCKRATGLDLLDLRPLAIVTPLSNVDCLGRRFSVTSPDLSLLRVVCQSLLLPTVR